MSDFVKASQVFVDNPAASREEVLQLLSDEAVALGMAEDAAAGTISPADINDEAVASRLSTAFMPDPDLLIRTGGDMRVSNYLLWEIAYTEIVVTPTYWPDFSKRDFIDAIADFQHRQRRFGLTGEQIEQR